MRISLSEGTWDTSTADIVAIPVGSGRAQLARTLGRIEKVMGKGNVKPLSSDERFEGKSAQTLKVAACGKAKARWLLLVGIGKEKEADKIAWRVGHAAASVVRAHKSVALEIPEVNPDSVRAATRGLVAGAYHYDEYKSDKKSTPALATAVILGAEKGARGLTAAIRAGQAVGESVNFARDVVNAPPEALISEAPLVPGTDGEKMSKSRGNGIPLFAPPKQLRKAVMSIKTSSEPLEAPKEALGSTVYALYALVAPERAPDMKRKLEAGGYGWGHAKQDLYEAIEDELRPKREADLEIRRDEPGLDALLHEGADKARAIADRTLGRVRSAVGIE